MRTDDEVLDLDILDHPDFVEHDDPRVRADRERATVYVPMLVYLLQRLGGPENSNGRVDDRGGIENDPVRYRLRDSCRVVFKFEADEVGGQWFLQISGWHPASLFLRI